VYGYVRTWDYDSPLGSANANTIDTEIQDFKKELGERLNNDHWFDDANADVNSLTAGDHRWVTMHNTGAVTAGTADTGIVHVEDVSTKAELFYMDEDDNDVQITSGGALAITTLTQLTISDALSVGGEARFNKLITADEDVSIGSDLTVGNRLTTGGDVIISGNLTVDGKDSDFYETKIKAWVNFDGSSTIADSWGVTSVADQGTGDFVITWATAFSNTEYVIVGCGVQVDAGNNAGMVSLPLGGNLTTTAAQIMTCNESGVIKDLNPTMVMAIGDN